MLDVPDINALLNDGYWLPFSILIAYILISVVIIYFSLRRSKLSIFINVEEVFFVFILIELFTWRLNLKHVLNFDINVILILLILVASNLIHYWIQKKNKLNIEDYGEKKIVDSKSSLNQEKNSIETERIQNFERVLQTYEGVIEMKTLSGLLDFKDEIVLQKWLLSGNFQGYTIKDGMFSVTSNSDLSTSIDALINSFGSEKA